MAYQARIHTSQLQGTSKSSRRCAWMSATGLAVRPSDMAGFVAPAANIDEQQAALGGSAI